MRDMSELAEMLERGLEAWQSEIFEREALKIGRHAVDSVKDLTPVVTGHLRRNWYNEVTKEGNDYIIWIKNNVVYGPAVNYGRRTKNGGMTRGQYMLETGIENYKQSAYENDINAMILALQGAFNA